MRLAETTRLYIKVENALMEKYNAEMVFGSDGPEVVFHPDGKYPRFTKKTEYDIEMAFCKGATDEEKAKCLVELEMLQRTFGTLIAKEAVTNDSNN
jgi:hypothetical protein